MPVGSKRNRLLRTGYESRWTSADAASIITAILRLCSLGIVGQNRMTGPIAQIVALTCHGNASLHGTDVGDFFPKSSTCDFCDRVTFVTIEKSFFSKTKEQEVAKTPQEWFAYLKSTGAKGIRLSCEPQNDSRISDRMSAGFVGGGGTWCMEILHQKNQSDFWIARWEVWNQDAPEQRIWRVTYARAAEGVTARSGLRDVQSTLTHLAQALREIHAFSAEHDCGGFTQCFSEALDTLDSDGTKLHGYHKDLAPDGSTFHSKHRPFCMPARKHGSSGEWGRGTTCCLMETIRNNTGRFLANSSNI